MTKRHAAIISELLKKLDHLNNTLYEVELAKTHWTRRTYRCRVIRCSICKIRMLELYDNLSNQILWCTQVRGVGKGYWISPSNWPRRRWKILSTLKGKQSGSDCDHRIAKWFHSEISYPDRIVQNTKKHEREPGLFKEQFRRIEMLSLCNKTNSSIRGSVCLFCSWDFYVTRNDQVPQRSEEEKGNVCPIGENVQVLNN